MEQRILTEVLAELTGQERTVRWLAIKLSMEPSRVWRICNGQRPMPADVPDRVAEVLGRPVAVLVPEAA